MFGGKFWNALICDDTPPPIVTGVTVGAGTCDAVGCIGVTEVKKFGALFSDKSLLALLELDNSESCDGERLWSKNDGWKTSGLF